MGASLKVHSYDESKSTTTLEGLPSTLIDVPLPAQNVGEDEQGPFTEIVVPDVFPPGSIMVFATSMAGLSSDLDEVCLSGADEAFKSLDLVDLNVVLFRADGEEMDATGEFEIFRFS